MSGPKAAFAMVAVLALTSAATHAQPRPEQLLLQIEAPSELHGVAAQLARVDARRFEAFARRLGSIDRSSPIRVVLATNDSPLGRGTPAWIAGFADSASDTVVLFPARSPSYPYDSIEDVLRHEVAHVLIARAAPGVTIPRWLHEGLAMSAEDGRGLVDHGHLALAWMSGRVRISQLDAEFQANESRAARAYATAYLFVRDLIARHGADLPRRLLARLAAGDSIERAIATTTGTPLDGAEREFWRDRWWYQIVPLATSSLALWMAITLLMLYGIRRRARRRAELRRKWDEEELDYATRA
jgi:hypothetical protein